jgi:hypothetical protein
MNMRWSASVSEQFVLGVKEVGAQRTKAARSLPAQNNALPEWFQSGESSNFD